MNGHAALDQSSQNILGYMLVIERDYVDTAGKFEHRFGIQVVANRARAKQIGRTVVSF